MDKEKICRDYKALKERIVEAYSDRDIPTSVQCYYLLCELISGGSEKYFVQIYGERPLDPRSAEEGKIRLDLGPLTDFEMSAAEFFNSYIDGSQGHQFR